MYSGKKEITFYLFITMLICFSCSSKSKLVSNTPKDQGVEQGFQMVAVPANLKDPAERANYLAQHYWDNYDFRDTSYIGRRDISEQAFVDYLQILPIADKDAADSSIVQVIKKAEQENKMLKYFLQLFNTYLYSPISPQKNEEFYIVVTEAILKSDSVDTLDKVKAQFNLDMLLKNRLGQPAADVSYTLISGNTSSLYALNKEYTILMFYDPDCHACHMTTDYMKASATLQNALESKSTDILLVYPGDNTERWTEYSTNIPPTWINGMDQKQSVYSRRLYDLRALPTLYLLDKDKNVLLKDVGVDEIEVYLINNQPSVFNKIPKND